MKISLLGGSIITLLFFAFVTRKIRSVRRRKAPEQLLRKYDRSRLALLRYVMLNRQCSEERAYQRIATFVKKQSPLDDESSIDEMLSLDRQNLLYRAQSLIVQDLYKMDEI